MALASAAALDAAVSPPTSEGTMTPLLRCGAKLTFASASAAALATSEIADADFADESVMLTLVELFFAFFGTLRSIVFLTLWWPGAKFELALLFDDAVALEDASAAGLPRSNVLTLGLLVVDSCITVVVFVLVSFTPPTSDLCTVLVVF